MVHRITYDPMKGRAVRHPGDRFIARVCARCKRPGGTVSFRYVIDGTWKRDYFHPHCFKVEISDKEQR